MTKTTPTSEQEVNRQKRETRLTIIGIAAVIAVMSIVYAIASPKLKIENLVIGTGQEAKAGDMITVHYTGWLADKTKLESSLDKNKPFEFVLGKGKVIQGWDKGIVGMKVGGKRRLIIPPEMAYGEEGSGKAVPPNATLTFEVKLLSVKKDAK